METPSRIKKIEELDAEIQQLVSSMANARDTEEYDRLYDQFEQAHDQREVLWALVEADAFISETA